MNLNTENGNGIKILQSVTAIRSLETEMFYI